MIGVIIAICGSALGIVFALLAVANAIQNLQASLERNMPVDIRDILGEAQ